ncbi:MAG: hypothetical protein A2Y12_14600 [Planctomycetes bacterium GWF2_42_9]|nr:MAG: hypothetical protein A2Y12_14600 [Planctomycetes bacterium GWF2_42_9]HAL45871.1 hypothetical protein [Phycisphaerales bacterium]
MNLLKEMFLVVAAAVLLLPFSGCQENQSVSDSKPGTFQKTCIFAPQKITFNQLTEFSKRWQIVAYIDVYDQFNSRIKAAGIWRFELYPKVLRSADPAGGRIKLWSDIDLTQAAVNNGYWQDYLRCYKFELPLETEVKGGTYILEAVCFTAEGKRITNTVELKR